MEEAGFVFKEVKPKSEKSYRFTKEMIHDMCKYFQSNPIPQSSMQRSYFQQVVEHFDYFGFDPSTINIGYMITTVRNIYMRKIHTDVTSQYNY